MMATSKQNATQDEQTPRSTTLRRVNVKGGGDAVDHDARGGVTIGKDADGKVVFVDFGGADVEVE